MSRPIRGTECEQCRVAGGHRCEAMIFVEEIGRRVPLCMACADGELCAVVKLAGAGRDGSAVRTELNMFLEEVPIGFPEVVHRAPEEIGVPRAIVSPRPRPIALSTAVAEVEAAPVIATCAEVYEHGPKPGAIQPIARDAIESMDVESRGEETVVMTQERSRRGRIPEEVKAKIRAAAPEVTHAELARKYGVSDVTVGAIRNGAGKPKEHNPRPATSQSKLVTSRSEFAVPSDVALQPALADPAPQPAPELDRIPIALELSRADLHRLVDRLTPVQLSALVGRGLQAALTTSGF